MPERYPRERYRAEVLQAIRLATSFDRAARRTMEIRPTGWALLYAACVQRAYREWGYAKAYARQHRLGFSRILVEFRHRAGYLGSARWLSS
jgi:hypothetical protein